MGAPPRTRPVACKVTACGPTAHALSCTQPTALSLHLPCTPLDAPTPTRPLSLCSVVRKFPELVPKLEEFVVQELGRKRKLNKLSYRILIGVATTPQRRAALIGASLLKRRSM